MENFDYQGDLDGLNQIHMDFVSKVLSERGFKPAIVKVEQVGKLGDNYQANMKRFIIDDFRMVAKLAISTLIMREQMHTAQNFHNEILIYSKMMPKFAELLKEVGAGDCLPISECYGCFTEEPNEVILLEDLSVNDYEHLNKLEPLPVDAVEKTLKGFAAIHGLSYVLKTRDREFFNSISQGLKAIEWSDLGDMYVATMTAIEADMLQKLDCEKYKEKAKGLMVNHFPLVNQVTAEDLAKTDCTVILQGDAWTNNLMFKYEDGNLDSLIVIDYQLSRESNPVLDLTYMIFNCTDYEMRAKHFHRWLDLYHEELTRITSLFGVDVNQLYSREDLDRSLKRYAKAILGIALMFITFVFKEPDEVFDFKTEYADRTDIQAEDYLEWTKTSRMSEKSLLRLKSRLNGLFRSFEDLGLFEDDVWI